MKLAILNLTAGGMSGGYKKYLMNILPLFLKHDDVESILCIYPAGFNNGKGLIEGKKILSIFCKPYFPFTIFPDYELKQKLQLFKPDAIFIPLDRYFWFPHVPIVNMVQNMLPLTDISNNPLFERARNILLKNIGRRAVLKSQKTIAVSSYVKEYLVDKWRVEADRVPIIYHGVEPCDDQKTVRPVSIPLEWGAEFLFTAGSVDPYRGLEDIFEALFMLQARGLKLKVVVAGEARPSMMAYKRKLQNMLTLRGIAEQVCWVGFLKIPEMLWCYRNCTAFVSTTRVEACPNIALEAMACGSVIISADNKPMPEFFKDNAFYYPSRDAARLSEEIKKVLALSVDERRRVAEKVRIRAKDFSWDQAAQRTIEELAKTIRSFSGKQTAGR